MTGYDLELERERCAALVEDLAQRYAESRGASMSVSEVVAMLESLKISIMRGERPA